MPRHPSPVLDGPASLDAIRSSFPALDRSHDGVPVAYFDGPGGTQVPRVVADAVTDYLFHHNANTYWHYPTSHETRASRVTPARARSTGWSRVSRKS